MAERTGPHAHHGVPLNRRELLLFEAGIKLGGIFHQYLGIPVSPRTAVGLARTIEAAVALQPYITSVHVDVDPRRGGGALGKGRFAYRYLTPEMLRARVVLRLGSATVQASLEFRPELHYTLMRVEAASPADGPQPPPRRGRRRR